MITEQEDTHPEQQTHGVERRAFSHRRNFDVESNAPRSRNTPVPVALSAGDREFGMSAQSAPPYLDKHWATAFKIVVLMAIVLALSFGSYATKIISHYSFSNGGGRGLEKSSSEAEQSDNEHNGGVSLLLTVMVGVILLPMALLVSVGMLSCFLNCSRAVIFTTSWLVAIGAGVKIIVCIHLKYYAAAIVGVAVLVLAVQFIRKGRRRTEFSAANLKVAAIAIDSMPSARWYAFAMVVLQFLWGFIIFMAALGSFVNLYSVTALNGTSYHAIDCRSVPQRQCMCDGEIVSETDSCHRQGIWLCALSTIFWLVSFLWGSNVIKNVVTATVTGSVASWWFTPSDASPVKGAFHRATHSSFGSLCKAGAVLYAMHFVNGLLRLLLFLVPYACYILTIADWGMDYLLSYVVCFIAVYGSNFGNATKQASELFRARAVTVVANDLIADLGLKWVAATGSSLYVVSSFMLTYTALYESEGGFRVDNAEMWLIVGLAIFGVVLYYLLIAIVLEVVRAGYKTVFVCFVQDAEALIENHGREVHHNLTTAWASLQSEINGVRPVAGAPVYNQVHGDYEGTPSQLGRRQRQQLVS